MAMLILFPGCIEQEEFQLVDLEKEVEVKETSVSNARRATNGLPVVRFHFLKKKGTKVTLKDSFLESTDKVDIVTLSIKAGKTGKVYSVKWTDLTSNESYLAERTIEDLLRDLFQEDMGYEVNSLTIGYFGTDGEPIKDYEFDVYTDGKGINRLQKPGFGVFAIVAGVNAEEEKPGTLTLSAVVENDPAGVVKTVQARVEGIKGGSESNLYTLKRGGGDHLGVYIFSVEIEGINSKPILPGTFIMMDAKGEQVGELVTTDLYIQKADFTGRIRRIRIRENQTDTSFRTIVVVAGDTNNDVAYVEVKMNASDVNPTPIPAIQYATRVKTNEKGVSRYVYSPVTFEKGIRPIEKIYTVTATMLAKDGTPLAPPQAMEVEVEGEINQFQGTRIYSMDQGKTWTITASFRNPESWVEGVEIEFVKPFEGPEPTSMTLKLVPVSEEADGTVIYASSVTFKGDPTGFDYTMNVYQFGTGTRSTAGSASTKAELL